DEDDPHFLASRERERPEGGTQAARHLDGLPTGRTGGAVGGDPSSHFVVAGLGRRHVTDAVVAAELMCQLLGEGALARPGAAGDGDRAQRRSAADGVVEATGAPGGAPVRGGGATASGTP